MPASQGAETARLLTLTPDALDGGKSRLQASGDPFDDEYAPEALFISALLDHGQYVPETYRITDEMFLGWSKVHAFCLRYQGEAGQAPTPDLVVARHPNFPYIRRVSIDFASTELVNEFRSREMRKAMSKATRALQDGAVDEAEAMLLEALEGPSLSHNEVASLDDYDHVFTDIPGVTMQGMYGEYLNDIQASQLWTLAARTNVGKSYELCKLSVWAAEAGWNVRFLSLEMPPKKVMKRLSRIALRDWRTAWSVADPGEVVERYKAWRSVEGRGHIEVINPRMLTPRVVQSIADPDTLTVIDYIGKMYTNAGQHVGEDYRAMNVVSTQIADAARIKGAPILQAAQLGRSGKDKPGLEDIAGADGIAHDADVAIFMTEVSRHVRRYTLPKVRDGAKSMSWFSAFDPELGDFEDLTYEEAQMRIARDLELEAMGQ